MEGDPPLNFIMVGGRPVGDHDDEEDEDLSPGTFNPAEVKSLSAALAAISEQEFDRRFNLETLASGVVYPDIWDEERAQLLEEYTHYFDEMKHFLSACAAKGRAVMVSIG